MTNPRGPQSLDALLEEMLGMPVKPEMRQDLERALGISFDDPASRAELKRRWDDMRPALASLPPDLRFEAELEAEAVFQAAVERLGEGWLDPQVLAGQAPGIRMLLATRAVEGLVANSGWVAVFVEDETALLPLAIDGYRLLGLEEHAALAGRVGRTSFRSDPDELDEVVWDAFDAEWFALADAESARAAYIDAHPEEFHR